MCPKDGGNVFRRNLGARTHLPVCTMSHSRRNRLDLVSEIFEDSITSKTDYSKLSNNIKKLV
jgi:hypothetical protein